MLLQSMLGLTIIVLCYVLTAHVDLSSAQSCKDAGYTGCCNQDEDPDLCQGRPLGICFCDPRCMEFGDCCPDITDICNPERDALSAILKPQATYTSSVFYQSATIHWVSMPYVNNTYTNETLLSYSLRLLSPSSTIINYSTQVIARGTDLEYTSYNEEYTVSLQALEPNTHYVYNLTAVTWFGDIPFEITGSFVTLDPSSLCVDNVQLSVLTSSSLQIIWSSSMLSPGVTVTGHVIHYQELPLGPKATIAIVNNSFSNSYVLSELREDVRYSISMATVWEEGGREMVTEECEKNEVYIPGSQLFQLTVEGSFLTHCLQWEVEDEETLLTTIRDTIVSRIRETLDSEFPSTHIRNDYVICHPTTTIESAAPTDSTVHRLTYRARLYGTVAVSVTTLLHMIRDWTQSDYQFSQAMPLTSPMILLHTDCPLALRTQAHPLCEPSDPVTPAPHGDPATPAPHGDPATPAPATSGCISIPIFVTSLLALFMLMMVVAMVITIILVCRLGNKKDPISSHDVREPLSTLPHSCNVYTPSPSNTETMAARQDDHTHNSPLTNQVADGSTEEVVTNQSEPARGQTSQEYV